MSIVSSMPYNRGDEIPFRVSPGIVVASCIPCLAGCITTVELLHRKRSIRGWLNWVYQLGISVSFGLVGIWCMHYVANRSLILGDGRAELQLFYSPGFTALSAFLPIIFLFFGFSLVEYRQPEQRFFWPLLVVTGVIAGLAITGMHYIGNFGVANYDLINPIQYILGAAAIAILASISALALFFYFKNQWINSFLRRLACAVLLAGAVSGMHWVGSMGTSYHLKYQVLGKVYDRNVNLIVAMICGVLACVVCLVFAFLTQRRKKKLADRAQHVVLASATFDHEGRILVTQEGLPPSVKVTKQFNQKSFDDEFNVAHPVFQWLYRVTYNWTSIADLIPGMRTHLRAVGFIKDRSRHSRPATGSTSAGYEDSDIENDYSVLFREYFCVAAEELAGVMDVPLPQLGVMYSDIVATGSLANEFKKKRINVDVEQGIRYPGIFGKGQLLFLVRNVDKIEAGKLTAAGYRFAAPKNVTEIISRAMKIPHSEIVDTIERLRVYSQPRQPLASSGTYLACFAIRAGLKQSNRSWDILVPTDHPGDLPCVELSSGPLKGAEISRLQKLDGLSVSQSITYLNNIAGDIINDDEKAFIEHLLDQIMDLCRQVPEAFFSQAIFSCTPVTAPGLGDDRDASPPNIYAFSVIPDVHGASIKSTSVTYIPLSFFQCIQRVYKHSPDHDILAQRIHREFASILSHRDIAAFAQRNSRRPNDKRHSRLSIPSVSLGGTPRDSSSPLPERDFPSLEKDRETVGSDVSPNASSRRRSHAFGGIMVSSDTKVEVFDKKGGNIALEDMGVRSEATVASEAPTYVDDLFRMTSARWRER